MLDYFFAIGQAASVLLILFGAVLTLETLLSPKRGERKREDEMLLLRYIL